MTIRNETIMDVQWLAILEQETSSELLAKMIGMFVNEIGEHVAALREAGRQADPPAIAAELHALKSGAGNFGALKLQDVTRCAESMRRDGSLENTIAAISIVADVCEETIAKYARRFDVSTGERGTGEAFSPTSQDASDFQGSGR